MNTSVRAVMAEFDCKMRELNDATNRPMIDSPSQLHPSSSFSDISDAAGSEEPPPQPQQPHPGPPALLH